MARLLGLDPGAARCGVALTNTAATMAFPRSALANDDALLASLRAIVDDELVGEIVVGRPVALSGRETASTALADELFALLAETFDEVVVTQWDERLTTVEAARSLSEAGRRAKEQRERVDSAAAVIMLQNYVDGHRAS